MDHSLLSKHYRGRESLKAAEAKCERHRWLFWFAALALKTHGSSADRVTDTTHPRPLSEKIDYELEINKLKIEHSSKTTFQEAKLDALKEENTKLKAKLLALEKAAASAATPRRDSALLRLNKKPEKESPFIGKARNLIFTPREPSLGRTASQTVNNILGRTSPRGLFPDTTFISSTPFRQFTTSTPYKQLPAGGFLDASTTDQSPSLELLKRKLSLGTASTHEPTSDEENFASANSSLADLSTGSIPPRKRIRKLKLRNAARVMMESAGVVLDEEGVNTADYYQDANFDKDKTASVPADIMKPPPQRAKRKKVFSID